MSAEQVGQPVPPVARLHVRPDQRGVWRVHCEGKERVLSEHLSETEAERAAARLAAVTGVQEVIVHDRYHRVHNLP
jgi:hypothetical protein